MKLGQKLEGRAHSPGEPEVWPTAEGLGEESEDE